MSCCSCCWQRRHRHRYGQTAQSSTLTINVGSSFNIPIGKSFRLSLPVRVNAMYDNVETNREAPHSAPEGATIDSQQGNVSPSGDEREASIRGWSFTPSVNLGFEIHSRNRCFYLSAGLGAALKGLYYNKLNYTKLVLNPSMGINYTFSANSKLQFSTGYTTQIGDMMTLLTEPMQVDYRSVRTSSGIIGESNTWHTRLELDNLLNQRHYAYTVFDGINTYTYDYALCGRTAMLRLTFKL